MLYIKINWLSWLSFAENPNVPFVNKQFVFQYKRALGLINIAEVLVVGNL